MLCRMKRSWNHIWMITIYSFRLEKLQKKVQFPPNSWNLSQKGLPPRQSPGKKSWWQKRRKWGGKKSKGEKVKTALSLLNPKTISKFCFLRMPEICKVIPYIPPCIKYFAGERPRSAWPALGFVVSFRYLNQKMALLKRDLRRNSEGASGLSKNNVYLDLMFNHCLTPALTRIWIMKNAKVLSPIDWFGATNMTLW